ncbi:alpha/beta fold hydrolase [Serinicoccus kebangsaanensis]|uniref:alpha/beta fold hydrolase n=1 Tax=Serinicoccus kebangsaanensis TaxID=2602069 RepID=UPI00124BE747|nr:alpha/beta hydrolase [Serinicoccus kebangsaanensis]
MRLATQVHAGGPDEAPTVAFLHGFGTSSWMWADQVSGLAGRVRCLTIDLPGFGGSREVEWTSFADTADLVAEELARQGGPVHVVGLSLGGYVGWHLLRDHPDLLASLVLSGVSLQPVTPSWFWRGVARWGAPVMTSRVLARVGARAMQLPAEAHEAYVADTTGVPHRTFRRVYEEVTDFAPPPLQTALPVLLLAGGAELAPVRRSLEVGLGIITGAHAASAPGLHHGWNGEDPDLFNATVLAWIRGEDLPADLEVVGAVGP